MTETRLTGDEMQAISDAQRELCTGPTFPEATAYSDRLDKISARLTAALSSPAPATEVQPKEDERVERLENEAVVFKHVIANLTRQITDLYGKIDAATSPRAETAPYTPTGEQRLHEAQTRVRQLEGWLNDAATALGGCDLDQVANVIRKRAEMGEGVEALVAKIEAKHGPLMVTFSKWKSGERVWTCTADCLRHTLEAAVKEGK